MLVPVSNCVDEKQPVTRVIFLILMLIVPSLLLSAILYQDGVRLGIQTNLVYKEYISPEIDGRITYEEWYKSNLYMLSGWFRFDDTDNGKKNGWNYLTVGQDADNIYIALDMPSFSQSLPSETLEIHFITNSRYFNTESEYSYLLGFNGVEAMIIDVASKSIVVSDSNTINEYLMDIEYHATERCEESHRNIEISISKKELNDFSENVELGILVIGRFDGGSYHFAANSLNREVVHYDSSCYIGINMTVQR